MNFFKNKIKFLIIFLAVLIFPISSYTYAYIWSTLDPTALTSALSTSEVSDDTANPLNLDCGSAILIEQHTGQILYSYNCHESLRPASVTKLMSIFLIMESIESGKITYETKIPCSENAASMGGSQIWLDSTETLSVDEMLKAICVVSANDCVTAMAEYLGGTEENFVTMMNDKAKELGMNDTTFKNCHGIDEDGHVMSSYDIATLSRALLNTYPEITKYTTIYMDSLRDGKSSLVNTNKLVRNYNGCTGLKTGSTSLALYNLSASASRDGMDLIAVVMKAPTSQLRFKNASSLLDYGFNNFEYKKLASAGDIVKSIKVNKGILGSVDAIAENDIGTLISKGNDVNIEQNISLNDTINAPVPKGQIIGSVTYSLNEEVIGNCNLISSEYVDKLGVFSMDKLVLKKWLYLLR